MKYLKYFENKDYFQEISEISPGRIFHKNEKFTEKEIDIIRIFVESKNSGLHLYKNPKGNDLQILERGSELCWIYKMSDEWYYLFDVITKKTIAYRCDQLDGLLKCIEEKIISKDTSEKFNIQIYESNRRVNLPIKVEPKKDLKEFYLNLSDYLQEIFDRYNVIESDSDQSGSLKNRWYLSEYNYRSMRLIIQLEEEETYQLILSDIRSMRNTLNRRLGDGLKIRIHNYSTYKTISIMITQHKVK